jgi:hypothetical protein
VTKKAHIVYPDGMVVSERELCQIIGGLRLRKLPLVIESFSLIAEATSVSVEERIDDWSLRLIKQVAREVRSKPCRALIKAIAVAVEDRYRGIAAARLTVIRVSELLDQYCRFNDLTPHRMLGSVIRQFEPPGSNRANSPPLQVVRRTVGSTDPEAITVRD